MKISNIKNQIPKNKAVADEKPVSGAVNKKVKEPETMEELLVSEGVELRGLKRGDTVEGIVTEIGPKRLYLDIGAKTDGIVTDKEYATADSYIKTLDLGDKIDAFVLSPENDSGQILLSLRDAAADYTWGRINEWLTAGEVIKVKVRETNRGGAIVFIVDELEGFIPSSQFTAKVAERLSDLVNKEVEVKVIDADRSGNKVILSEKAVSEADDLAKKQAVLSLLSEGVVYEGVVTRVVDFGLFVKIDVKSAGDEKKKNKQSSVDSEMEVPEGLVHISELSWEKVSDPSEVAREGDKVKVMVLQVDPKIGKLSLSIKRLQDDPWKGIEEKYPIEKQTKGKVVEVLSFGIFVELEPGISGLVHISKLVGKDYKVGDKVECYVESVDKKGRRLSLGLVLTAKPVGYK